jgi:hypothetical protein
MNAVRACHRWRSKNLAKSLPEVRFPPASAERI